MADVTVTVAGRNYRLACNDGEEAHLKQLAAGIDGQAQTLLRQLRTQPEETRLLLMIALMLADRVAEAEAAAAATGRDAEALAKAETRLAEVEPALATAAEELETLAGDLERGQARIAELEAALAERETAVAERETAVAERDARVLELERALSEAAEREAAERETAKARAEEDTAPGQVELFAGEDGAERAARIHRIADRIEGLTARIGGEIAVD